ncbi:MAG: DUF2628 domain-containing protein [Deltaproteobacteria bacterium]|nr:DUF2628 domain-containing protein [Deltaproteobacteria bacterium]
MAIYTIYKHDEAGLVQPVKLGFSWPAFFFGIAWAVFKQLWLVASLMMLGSITFTSISGMIASPETPPDPNIFILWALSVSALFGAYGNDWVRKDLERQGYQVMCEVEANTPQDALERFEESG